MRRPVFPMSALALPEQRDAQRGQSLVPGPRSLRPEKAVPHEEGSLPCVEELDPVAFNDSYARRCMPVVVRGGAQDWGAIRRWTLPYLRSRLGDLEVPHRRTPREQPEIGVEDVHLGMTSASEVLKRCAEPGSSEEYIPGLNLKDCPSLGDDIAPPAFVDASRLRSVSIFLGRNTRCLGHFHPFAQAVLTQVVGEKDVDLYAPRDLGRVYLRNWYEKGFFQSRVNFHGDHEGQFPRLAEATRWTVRLRPGDQLFIPVHWLHVPTGNGMTASVTHWWRARWQEWGGPGVGARCIAGLGMMSISDLIGL